MTATAPRRRRADSVRFDPYYKVQVYERMAWVDIQHRYDTPEAAIAAYPAGKRCRVMRITVDGRAPLDD